MVIALVSRKKRRMFVQKTLIDIAQWVRSPAMFIEHCDNVFVPNLSPRSSPWSQSLAHTHVLIVLSANFSVSVLQMQDVLKINSHYYLPSTIKPLACPDVNVQASYFLLSNIRHSRSLCLKNKINERDKVQVMIVARRRPQTEWTIYIVYFFIRMTFVQ